MNVAALFLKHLLVLIPWTKKAAPENLSSRDLDLAGQIKIYQSQMLERFSLDELEYAANLHHNYTNDKQAHHETICRMGNEQTQAYLYALTHHYSYLMSQGRPIQDLL